MKRIAQGLFWTLFVVLLPADASPGTHTALVTTSWGKCLFCQEKGRVEYEKSPSGALVFRVDLGPIKAKANLVRAVFHPFRGNLDGRFSKALEPVVVRPLYSKNRPKKQEPLELREGDVLPLVPPYYREFDVTSAVRETLRYGGRTFHLKVESFPDLRPEQSWFEFTYPGKLSKPMPEVHEVRAFHHNGQTFITWREVEDLITSQKPTVADYVSAGEKIKERERTNDPYILRYHVYRSSVPIVPGTFGHAKRVAVVGSLSGYNIWKYGMDWYTEKNRANPLETFVIEDGGTMLPFQAGLFVFTPEKPVISHYSVVVSVNGVEDLSSLRSIGPVVETPASLPEPVLQSKEESTVLYGKGTIYHYVQWANPPLSNVPGQAYNWIVAVPEKPVWPAPLQIGLHSWGATPWGGYGWWYGWREGTMLMATNDYPPQTWWYGYHEAHGTYRPWSEGKIHNYTERRILSMLEWVKSKWIIDESRIFAAGNSMGGSGTSAMAMRHSETFAFGISWVGIHDFTNSPRFTKGLYTLWGDPALRFENNEGELVWNWVNLPWYLRRFPERETGFLTFSNGKNDNGIGWGQAVDFVRALWETKRPFIFVWGQGGHGQRAYVPTADGGGDNAHPILDIRKDQSLPAFARCSLDNDIGNGDPNNGDPKGQINLYLRWEPNSVVDEPDRYEITVYLIASAPKEICTVDMTPRHVQRFRITPGETVMWENRSQKGQKIQAGEVRADAHGFVTLPGLLVGKGKSNIVLRRTGA